MPGVEGSMRVGRPAQCMRTVTRTTEETCRGRACAHVGVCTPCSFFVTVHRTHALAARQYGNQVALLVIVIVIKEIIVCGVGGFVVARPVLDVRVESVKRSRPSVGLVIAFELAR